MTRKVVLVDPYSSGARITKALRKAGFEPVGVTSYPAPSHAYTGAFAPEDFDLLFAASDDLKPLISQLAELDPIAVIPGAESGVILADILAARLTPGRANAPALARSRRHKGEMVEALLANGVPAIRTTYVRDPEEAELWVSRMGLIGQDLVVKPSMSAATDGVTLVPGGEGLELAVAGLLHRVNLMGVPNDEIVVQERIKGTEYVVDTFSYDGHHTVTNICRYNKVASGSNFAVYESIEFLPYDSPGHSELIDYVKRALDALGIKFGLAHNEVMHTLEGPRLIETGARPPGAGLPALCELATGESGIDRLIRHLSGRGEVRHDFTLDWHVSGVYFVAPESGRISNLAAYKKLSSLPSCRHVQINVAEGDLVEATSDLMSTMKLGWAVLAHKDPDQIRRDHAMIREIESEVTIEKCP